MLLAKKIFEFHAQVQKCHFGNFLILPKWHFWTLAWNSNFLKKPSRELKNYFCFRFLWISRRPGTLNWERVFFWLSKNLYSQCEVSLTSILRWLNNKINWTSSRIPPKLSDKNVSAVLIYLNFTCYDLVASLNEARHLTLLINQLCTIQVGW